MPDGVLSPKDYKDLQQISALLPKGSAHQKAISTLLSSQPTQFEQERTPDEADTGVIGRGLQYAKGLGQMAVGAILGSNPAPYMTPEDIANRAADLSLADAYRADQSAGGYGKAYRVVAGLGTVAGVNPIPMEESARHGDPAGVLTNAAVQATPAVTAGLIGKFGPKVLAKTANLRNSMATSIAEPITYENLGETKADLRFGVEPEQALIDEGIKGTRKQMSKQADARIKELKASADNILQNHPNSQQTFDVAPLIDAAVDDGVASAKRQGASTERLENLRTALKTEYGSTNGTPYDLNNLKTAIQHEANNMKAYANTQPQEAAAARVAADAASRVKDQVNSMVPEGEEMNRRMSNLIDAKAGIDRNILAERGKPMFHNIHGGATSAILNKSIASPFVRSNLAAALTPDLRLGIPQPMTYTPTPTPPPSIPQPAPAMPAPTPAAQVGQLPQLGFPPYTPNPMWTPRIGPVNPSFDLPATYQPFTTPASEASPLAPQIAAREARIADLSQAYSSQDRRFAQEPVSAERRNPRSMYRTGFTEAPPQPSPAATERRMSGETEPRKSVYEMRKGAMQTPEEREAEQMGQIESIKKAGQQQGPRPTTEQLMQYMDEHGLRDRYEDPNTGPIERNEMLSQAWEDMTGTKVPTKRVAPKRAGRGSL